MTFDTKLLSWVQSVLRSEITVVAKDSGDATKGNYGDAVGDVVIVGNRVGVTLTGPASQYGNPYPEVSVDFNPATLWNTDQFDPANLPAKSGGKLYMDPDTGLLTSVSVDNVPAGIYWGTITNESEPSYIKFSLAQ